MKKEKIKLGKEEKDFIKQISNYALLLCMRKEYNSINELSNLIKLQNERRVQK